MSFGAWIAGCGSGTVPTGEYPVYDAFQIHKIPKNNPEKVSARLKTINLHYEYPNKQKSTNKHTSGFDRFLIS